MAFAAGPWKAIGNHASIVVTRVNPEGPSIVPYGNVKSSGMTAMTVAGNVPS